MYADCIMLDIKYKNNLILDVKQLITNNIKNNIVTNSITFIKNYEDALHKIFKSHANSNSTNDSKNFIWEINQDLFENINTLDTTLFDINNDLENVVIMGPYVRNCILGNQDQTNNPKNVTLRKEIYLYNYGNKDWNEIINNLDEYVDNSDEYYRILPEDRKVFIVKKKFKSLAHIILQHDYLKRIGWENGIFYSSSMFLLEFQKHKDLISSNFKDPILNTPYDPLEIYSVIEKNSKHPLKIIDAIDYDALVRISEKNLLKLYGGKTLIELLLDKYIKETHPVILENLEKMILFLCDHEFKRPPILYAKMLKLKGQLFDTIKSTKTKYSNYVQKFYDNAKFENINDINIFMIDTLIKLDLPNEFLNFIILIELQINKLIIDKLVNQHANNIINELIVNKILPTHLEYYLILANNDIDVITKNKLDNNIVVNFIEDIVVNGFDKSFQYAVNNDVNILTTLFEDGKNILHIIKPNKEYKNIIKTILTTNTELMEQTDNLDESPFFYHLKHNPKIFECFIEYDVDFTMLDPDGNNCLHFLCKFDDQKLLKKILKKYPELINMPNYLSEYPIITCCKHKQENMFYELKKHNVDLTVADNYGNTAYHYMCANSICLGTNIPLIKNYFGLTPIDYCKLSDKYYSFIDE